MLSRFNHWRQQLPNFQNPVQNQQAPILQVIIIGMIIISALTMFIFLAVSIKLISNYTYLIPLLSILCTFLATIASLLFLRRGHFNLSVSIIVLVLSLAGLLPILRSGLQTHWTAFFFFGLPIIFSGLLGTGRMVWYLVIAATLILTVIGWLSQPGIAMIGTAAPIELPWPASVSTFALLAGTMALAFHGFARVVQKSMLLAVERQQQLESIQTQQEQIIAYRTSDLQNALTTVKEREQQLHNTLIELQASQAAVQSLSAPIIPVLPGVLMVPLIGSLDRQRAEIMTANTLSLIEHQSTRAVIFDITGVEIVDTYVAQVLVHTALAVQLLGAEVLLVGTRPEVAQTLVALSVNMSVFTTFSDLRDAVTVLLMRDGWQKAGPLGA